MKAPHPFGSWSEYLDYRYMKAFRKLERLYQRAYFGVRDFFWWMRNIITRPFRKTPTTTQLIRGYDYEQWRYAWVLGPSERRAEKMMVQWEDNGAITERFFLEALPNEIERYLTRE